jgi:ABC-2 type transport system permease protein
MMRPAATIYRLGIKELWSLARDPAMLILIVYTFTAAVYIAATAMPDALHKTPIAIVDEDDSPLSARIATAFYPPYFMPPAKLALSEVDPVLDAGEYSFVLDIPPGFQRDVLAGRSPAMQLNVDATRMSQAFTGSGYIQQVALGQVREFAQRYRARETPRADLELRVRFNPNLTQTWFGAVMEIIDNITMLSIILAGAALIREREHGTIEHLLAMPVTPAEIMLSKLWPMALVVLLATGVSLTFIVRGALQVPISGSAALFMACAAMHLFATTCMGIFMATLARSMPQLALLILLTLLPLQMLSGGMTPRESMPAFARNIMLAAPTTHFVSASQAILFRAAGLEVVWPQLLALACIGALFFGVALGRFRKSLGMPG